VAAAEASAGQALNEARRRNHDGETRRQRTDERDTAASSRDTMATRPGYLGIDAGTQGLSVIFTDESLEILAQGEADYDMVPGLDRECYEQSPADWERALGDAMHVLRERLRAAGIEPDVRAIGISAQMHGEVLADAAGRSLGPARLWCDGRNEAEGEELTRRFGVKCPKRLTAARWLWTIRERPPLAARTAHVTTPAGWLAWRLTGEFTLGIGDAAGMFPIDQATLDYDRRLLDEFDAIVAGGRAADIRGSVSPTPTVRESQTQRSAADAAPTPFPGAGGTGPHRPSAAPLPDIRGSVSPTPTVRESQTQRSAADAAPTPFPGAGGTGPHRPSAAPLPDIRGSVSPTPTVRESQAQRSADDAAPTPFPVAGGTGPHRPSLRDMLPAVRRAGEDGGVLDAAGAALLGLRPGIPVAPAEGDQPAALVGSLIGRPGMVAMSFGTSVCANSVGDRPFRGVSRAIDHFCAPDGRPINMVWLRNGTTALNMVVEMLGRLGGGDPFGPVLAEAVAAADDCGGLAALPFMDDEPGLGVARGGSACLVGLDAGNATPGNAAKAMLLATIFNLRMGSDELDAQGFPRTEIVLSGGLTKTPALGQLVADAFATPVTIRAAAAEGTAWGAALLAKYRAVCCGRARGAGPEGGAPDWPAFLDAHATGTTTRFTPRPASVATLARSYERHRRLVALHDRLEAAS